MLIVLCKFSIHRSLCCVRAPLDGIIHAHKKCSKSRLEVIIDRLTNMFTRVNINKNLTS